jgi:hypothetical protein
MEQQMIDLMNCHMTTRDETYDEEELGYFVCELLDLIQSQRKNCNTMHRVKITHPELINAIFKDICCDNTDLEFCEEYAKIFSYIALPFREKMKLYDTYMLLSSENSSFEDYMWYIRKSYAIEFAIVNSLTLQEKIGNVERIVKRFSRSKSRLNDFMCGIEKTDPVFHEYVFKFNTC